jgi:16S rRNA (uracil1498-N3)-methyltransferase
MNLFYTPDITSSVYVLNEEESKHAVRVLRLKEGDHIQLIDGIGGFYKAEITDANAKRCSVKIIETQKEYGKRSFYLHIAIAPTKSIDRIEWFLEKATEIGVDEISPIECEHSERTIVKQERLNKILVSAMKQSVKAYLPKLNEMADFDKFVKQDFKGEKFIAHCHPRLTSGSSPNGEERKADHLKNLYTQGQNALILIGPEGDFSQKEVELALKNGFKEISLGNSRLRTETAALVACDVINILNG